MIALLSTPTAFEFRFESVSIGTRKSPLAIKQAEMIAAAIELNTLGTTTTLVPLDSEGDQNLRRDVPLAQAGVDFTTLIDAAVLERVCDVGVHSLKDVPPTSRWNPGLVIACHLPRASPLDVLVGAESLAALPPNARVGTASVRRHAQLRAARPDLELVNVRGSVGSRLAQLDAGDVDALCLAAAGVARLGESAMAGRANGVLPPDVMLPGAGQGIICATCRVGADEMRLLRAADDPDAHVAAAAERSLLDAVDGLSPWTGRPPVGTLMERGDAGGWTLRGLVARPDGSEVVRVERTAPAEVDPAEAAALGREAGEELVALAGADFLHH